MKYVSVFSLALSFLCHCRPQSLVFVCNQVFILHFALISHHKLSFKRKVVIYLKSNAFAPEGVCSVTSIGVCQKSHTFLTTTDFLALGLYDPRGRTTYTAL